MAAAGLGDECHAGVRHPVDGAFHSQSSLFKCVRAGRRSCIGSRIEWSRLPISPPPPLGSCCDAAFALLDCLATAADAARSIVSSTSINGVDSAQGSNALGSFLRARPPPAPKLMMPSPRPRACPEPLKTTPHAQLAGERPARHRETDAPARFARPVGLPAEDPDRAGLRRRRRDAARAGAQPVAPARQPRAAQARGQAAGVQLQAARRLQQDGAPGAGATGARRDLRVGRQPRPGRGAERANGWAARRSS